MCVSCSLLVAWVLDSVSDRDFNRLTGPDTYNTYIPQFYWTIVSTTTLKQADLTVSSPGARVISVILAYLGIILLALPLSVIGRAFKLQYDMLNMSAHVPDSVPGDEDRQAFFPRRGGPIERGQDASDKAC